MKTGRNSNGSIVPGLHVKRTFNLEQTILIVRTWIAFDCIKRINHGQFISPQLVLECQGGEVTHKEGAVNWAIINFRLNKFGNWSVVSGIVDSCAWLECWECEFSYVGRWFPVPYGFDKFFGSFRGLWFGFFFVDELELKMETQIGIGQFDGCEWHNILIQQTCS